MITPSFFVVKIKLHQIKKQLVKVLETKSNYQPTLHSALKWHAILEKNRSHSEAISNIVILLIDINEVEFAKRVLAKYTYWVNDDLKTAIYARIYTYLDNDMEAIKLWLKLFNPNLAVEKYRATFHLANNYLKINNFEKFLYYAKYTKKINPQLFLYEQLMMKYYYSIQDWDKTIVYCNTLIKNRFFVLQALDRLVKTYINAKNPDKAIYIITHNKEFDYVPKRKYYLLGRCYYAKYDYEKSIKKFLHSFKYDCNFKENIVWLGKSYYANKNFLKAKELYLRHKNDKDVLFNGLLAESVGLLSDAELEYNKHDKLNKLIEFLIKNRYWGKAYKHIRDELAQNKNNHVLNEHKHNIEHLSYVVGWDIEHRYRNNESIDNLMSSEAAITSLTKELNKNFTASNTHNKTIKRVALVLGSLGPGGAERQCTLLFNELQTKINTSDIEEVRLFVSNLSRVERDRFYLKDIPNVKFVIEYFDRKNIIDPNDVPILSKYSNIIKYIQPITRQQSIIHLVESLEEFSPDVVHAWLDETIINAFIAASIVQVPSIVGRWGSMPPGMGRGLSEIQEHNVKYLHTAYKQISMLPNIQFTANTQVTANAYKEWIANKDLSIDVIYNGLSFESLIVTREKHDLKQELKIPMNAKIVGSINRISEEKQPFLWVDIACEIIHSYEEEIYFVLVGDGPLYTHIEQYILELNMQNRILLCGNQNDVQNFYNIMDIFILTSKVEGLSNSMLEAQYLGIPVIVPDVGGLKEGILHGVTGTLLGKTADKKEFSAAILNLLERGWSTQNKIKNKEYITNSFSPKNMLNNTLLVYEKNLRKQQ